MRKIFSICIIALALIITPLVSNAQYDSDICKAKSGCTASEVGVFMQGISEKCGDLGDCTLNDIMVVFANTGNFVIGIVGGLVLLMYIIGGFYMLSSGGKQERIAKGKKYITTSTVGLLIVMFGYLGIFTLKSSLTGGSKTSSGVEYVICQNISKGKDATEGKACAINSSCVGFICVSKCEETHKGAYSCKEVDPKSPLAKSANCEANLCPGDKNVMCCKN